MNTLISFNNEINKFAARFGHQTNPGEFMLEGKLTKSDEVIKRLFKDGPVLATLPHGFKYNEQGIVEKNQIKWTLLEPDWKDKTPVIGKCFLEVVTLNKGFIGISRHCWIRLIDANGGVISVGFCGKVLKWLPFRAQKGKLASPDPGEFDTEGTKRVTRFMIDQDAYDHVKARVESDQKNKNLYFNMITRNCSVYVTELLKSIGINIENKEYPTQAAARGIFKKLNITPSPCVQKAMFYIAQVFRFILSPIYHLGILILGACYSDREAKALSQYKASWPKQPNKPFRNFWSLFDPSDLRFATGWKIAEWQEWVERKRAVSIQEAEQQGKLEDDARNLIQYGLPHLDRADFDLPIITA